MPTRVVSCRMKLNTLPLAPVPGLGLAAWLFGGPGAACAAVALWIAVVGIATTSAALRYRANRVEPGFAHSLHHESS